MNITLKNASFQRRHCQAQDMNNNYVVVLNEPLGENQGKGVSITASHTGHGKLQTRHDSGHGAWTGWVEHGFLREGEVVEIN